MYARYESSHEPGDEHSTSSLGWPTMGTTLLPRNHTRTGRDSVNAVAQESSEAAKFVLLLWDQSGAQTHGGQVQDRGQASTGPKSEEGWIAVIFSGLHNHGA